MVFFIYYSYKNMKKLSKILVIGLPIVLCVGLFAISVHGFWQVNEVNSIQGIPGASNATAWWSRALIDVIKNFINWVLGILSLIALIILLYGGFNMVTAAGDETKYKKGFKILQQAAVGLAVIGVSRLVVSVIFWLLGQVTSWT